MKRLTISLGLLLTLGVLGTPAEAQTGTARGKVLDQDGKPIAGAKILLEYQGGRTQNYDTETNKKGEFIQVGVYPGAYKVTATKDGFQGAVYDVRIALGDPTMLPEFRLVSLKAAAAAAATGPSEGEIRAQFEKASALTQQGQLDQAEALYKEILTKAPSVPEVHYNLGYIYTQRKDWTTAEAEFQKALELRPEYSDAIVALARVYQDSGDGDKAQQVIDKAVEAMPNDGKLLFNLAIFHVNAGQQQEAMEDLLKAEVADPTNAEIQYHLGTILVGQNKVAEAVERLEKYVSMSPANAQNLATAQALIQALKPKQ
jgi:tetratricopeptide (TPR) repeat protein